MALQTTYTHNYNKSPNNVASTAYLKIMDGFVKFDPKNKIAKIPVCLWEDSVARQDPSSKCLEEFVIHLFPSAAFLNIGTNEVEYLWDDVMSGVSVTDMGSAMTDLVAAVYVHIKTQTDFFGMDLTTSIDV